MPKRIEVGVVTRDKTPKTRRVEITRLVRHPKYGKTVPVRKKYHAHDETNDARTGDTVRIEETRPLSKSKRWRVSEVVERAR